MKSFIPVLLLAASLSSIQGKQLRFKSDGTFKIAQFTDMHFANDIDENRATQDVVTTVLKTENPNLVVLTGDMISGFLWNHTENWYSQLYQQVVQPMNDLDYQWAMTLGNHDHQGDLTYEQIHQLDMSYERSLTKPNAANISHNTNYILPIYDATGEQIVARI